MRLPLLLTAGLFLLFPMQVMAGTSFLENFEIQSDLTYVGSESCLDCHEDEADFYGTHSAHSVDLGFVVPGTNISSCEACHGPGSVHAEEEDIDYIVGIDALRALDDGQRAQMCLQCHTDHSIQWADSPHAGTEVSCNDCHADQVHFGGAAIPAADYRNQGEFCLQCHTSETADFRMPFRHRVLEGQMTCNDCHDPHAGFSQTAWNGLNDTCLECHTEMTGPFVFEHEGVAAENCTACHKPHGSMHDKMLTQDGNTLCLQCHYDIDFNADGNFALGDQAHGGLLGNEGRCYDCHVQVHGSNLDSNFQN